MAKFCCKAWVSKQGNYWGYEITLLSVRHSLKAHDNVTYSMYMVVKYMHNFELNRLYYYERNRFYSQLIFSAEYA